MADDDCLFKRNELARNLHCRPTRLNEPTRLNSTCSRESTTIADKAMTWYRWEMQRGAADCVDHQAGLPLGLGVGK